MYSNLKNICKPTTNAYTNNSKFLFNSDYINNLDYKNYNLNYI